MVAAGRRGAVEDHAGGRADPGGDLARAFQGAGARHHDGLKEVVDPAPPLGRHVGQVVAHPLPGVVLGVALDARRADRRARIIAK
eukprot:124980-Pyramimonas_sp.AAC.1